MTTHYIRPEAPSSFSLELARGNIEGHSVIEKFGENPDIDTASGFETIWDGGGVYVPPTTARLHDVASDDVNDVGTVASSGTATSGTLTSLTETGATFVTDGVVATDMILNDSNTEIARILSVSEETLTFATNWLDPNTGAAGTATEVGDVYRVINTTSTGAPIFHIAGLNLFRQSIEEFVVLDGLTPVTTALEYVRQHRARIFGSNTTGAEGTITSTAQTDGTITCQVVNGNNQTLMAIYTVPIDKIGFITRVWGSFSKKQAAVSNIQLFAGALDGIGYILLPVSISTVGSSHFDHPFPVPLMALGGSDLWVRADSDANDVGISAGFDIILVDN